MLGSRNMMTVAFVKSALNRSPPRRWLSRRRRRLPSRVGQGHHVQWNLHAHRRRAALAAVMTVAVTGAEIHHEILRRDLAMSSIAHERLRRGHQTTSFPGWPTAVRTARWCRRSRDATAAGRGSGASVKTCSRRDAFMADSRPGIVSRLPIYGVSGASGLYRIPLTWRVETFAMAA